MSQQSQQPNVTPTIRAPLSCLQSYLEGRASDLPKGFCPILSEYLRVLFEVSEEINRLRFHCFFRDLELMCPHKSLWVCRAKYCLDTTGRQFLPLILRSCGCAEEAHHLASQLLVDSAEAAFGLAQEIGWQVCGVREDLESWADRLLAAVSQIDHHPASWLDTVRVSAEITRFWDLETQIALMLRQMSSLR